ncbi:MAG TPA: glycosyltransferase [Streptosporangiaceae bacterium]|jgi:galactofuranosylgalactofuranosylrhamnosyl-N-acetylglucosaminyl-diphospho-decaprenol beta-1,5/1,6-galactofuranosyltransferase
MTDDSPASRSLRVLQRVVFPGEDLDVVPLYVEINPDRGAAELGADNRAAALGQKVETTLAAPVSNAAAAETQSSIRFGPGLPALTAVDAVPRQTAVIAEGRRVSFSTYFNAFPASYWRRWTTIDAVTLRIRVAGECTIIVYRSSARGHSYPVDTIRVETDQPETIERTLSLAPFIDGGWYWFDIVAGGRGTTLIEADWAALAGPAPADAGERPEAGERARPGRVSIGMTTINRTEFILDHLRTLGEAPEVLELLDSFFIVDQGTRHVTDHPDFADAAKKVGDKLRIIEQRNLGGSGGFSRSMDETVRAGQSDYLLILDDDIKIEPESIRRAATFADLTRRPTIVGGHMFSLFDRSVLHAFAESITPATWWWGLSPNTRGGHDFGRRNLRNTPWLHRRADADYNGWWMCLIPTKIIAEIGLALPVFIKWDDAEYSIRAREHGYPTVSLPGMATWHVTWQDKTDALDWQAYYHVRNRIISALLHSPHKRGGRLVAESAERQLQSLLSMQYSTAELRLLAIEDVLTGPDHLHRDLATRLKELQESRRSYPDAQGEADLESYPPARRKAPDNVKANTTPTNKFNLLTKAGAGTMRQFRAPRKGARQRPQMALPFQDAGWWVLVKLDSALVSAADGATAAWYQRDRKLFQSLGRRTIGLHAKLWREWPRLAAEYRAASAEFTSPEKWRESFQISPQDPPGRP